MKSLGYGLFVAGVIVSTCFAARPVSPVGTGKHGQVTPRDRVKAWARVAGVPFGAGFLLVVAGGVIARRRRKVGVAQGSERLGGAPEGALDLVLEGQSGTPGRPVRGTRRSSKAIMGAVRKKLEVIAADMAATEKAFGILDDIIENDVPEFLEQRLELIDELGLAKFAEMIGHFASMERNVARGWSAITDGADSELPYCIERARSGIQMAEESLS